MKQSRPILLVFLLFASASLHATGPTISSEFNHRSWTMRDGAPVDAWSIAQTPDGWLWFGAPTGLYRFDGVKFERVPLEDLDPRRSQAISLLYATDSGALWIGFTHGGVSLLENGRFTHFGKADGLERGTVLAMAEDARGAFWMSAAIGLFRYEAGKWSAVGSDSGFPDQYARSLYLDRSGTFWVAGQHEILYMEAGQQRLQAAGIPLEGVDGGEFIEAPDGRLWIASNRGVHSLPRQHPTAARTPNANSRTSYIGIIDNRGDYWLTSGGKVRRFPFDSSRSELLFAEHPNADAFTTDDGLSDVIAKTMLEDREGNIWVSTGAGIDRFRRTSMRALPKEVGAFGIQMLAPAENGAIWIGANIGGFSNAPSDGLWKFDGQLKKIPAVAAEGGVTSVAVDAHGKLWAASSNGIWRQSEGDRFLKFADPPADSKGQDLYTIGIDLDDNPWIAVTRSSLFRYRKGAWERKAGFAELPDARPTVIKRDREGRMWVGYTNNGEVAVVESGRARVYRSDDGLDVGRVFALSAASHVIVAGANRVAVLDGGRFHELTTPADPTVLQGVAGILESGTGDLWLMSFKGAIRVSARDFETALNTRSYELEFELFDIEDGFPGSAPTLVNGNDLIEGTDGRLWFAGSRNVAWIDPKGVRRNSIAPPLSIRGVTVADRKFPGPGSISLESGTRNLQIDYTALSLARPDRINFRYKLEGVDENWVNVGTRRQAFYTNLGPGDYRFRLAAANESGIWNESGAQLEISIPPTFVQTRTFLVLCAAVAFLLLWIAYLLRIQFLTNRMRHRLEERVGERERIARELHDTLLQGVQGLILKFQAVTEEIPNEAPARKMMEDALDRADDVLIEGRDRVKDLRLQPTTTPDLPQAIEAMGLEHAGEHSPGFDLSVEGAPRSLDPIVREEVLRIAREALANAFRHALAQKIEAEIIYDRAELRLRIRDDGRGIDGSILKSGRADHWGLPGMRERAKKIRANLEVWSRPGAGTEVALAVPAQIAYARKASRWAWRSANLRVEH